MKCKTKIKKIFVGGRGTYFCPNCQINKDTYVIGITGSIASGKTTVTNYLEELGYEVELINTGVTVSKYLQNYLKEKNLENNDTIKKEKIYLTKPEKEFKRIARNILDENLDIQAI